MEFELWWLLPIPVVFFALGWVAARRGAERLGLRVDENFVGEEPPPPRGGFAAPPLVRRVAQPRRGVEPGAPGFQPLCVAALPVGPPGDHRHTEVGYSQVCRFGSRFRILKDGVEFAVF